MRMKKIFPTTLLVTFLLLLMGNTAVWAAGAQLTGVRFHQGVDKDRIVLDLSSVPDYKITKDPDGKHLLLELAGTTDSVKVKSGGNYKLKIYSYTSGVGCMSAVMLPGLSDQPPQLLIAGDTVNVDFNAKSPGQYELVCAMGLPFNFKIIVE